MDTPEILRSEWVPAALTVILAVAVVTTILFWPSDESGRAQSLAGIFTLVAGLVVALFTWAYLKATQDILAVQREQLRQQRPEVIAEPRDGTAFLTGMVYQGGDKGERVEIQVEADVYFTNRSLTTQTTLRLLRLEFDKVPEQEIITLSFHKTGRVTCALEAGQTALLRATSTIHVPNRMDALPCATAGVTISVADSFSGPLPPIKLQVSANGKLR